MAIMNTSNGPRGYRGKNGMVWLAPGQSSDVEPLNPDRLHGDLSSGDPAEPGPLDQSVDDLTAHIATIDDADEIQALLDAETAGKSRKGALAALEARRDELLA